MLTRARARRASAESDGPLRAYLASTDRLDDTINRLEPGHLGAPTANGLSARDLVVHLAAQESLVAQSIDASPVPDVTADDVPTRTDAFVQRFAGPAARRRAGGVAPVGRGRARMGGRS